MKLNWNTAIGASMALLTTQAALSVAHAADVGMVAVAQNDVRLQLPGETKTRRIGAMQSLAENSRLRVGAGGRAVVVLYKDGSRFSLPAGSVAVVTGDGLKTEVGTATTLPALKIQQAKVLRGSRIAYGRSASMAARGGKHLELETLSTGATLDTRPTFTWTPMPEAASYQFQLMDEANKVVYKSEVTGNTLVFPANLPALQPDIEYLWNVSTFVGEPKSAEGSFHVISAKERADLQSELAALQTDATADADDQLMNEALRAEIYRKHELFDEAVKVYEKLLDKNPDSAALHSALAEILDGQGRSDASKLHSDKARQLEDGG